ncbi:glutamate receptor ionotropic, NMDA 2B-like isoform X2 [Varroa destructor]|uniref:Glutamate receptor ionotropic, NMDA 2B n=1 Tax=Varroa destructor TaxID=109461 RepID=A0A7M7JGS2_VARDE|nr:glutamate receptor ionotropic, NMDA 2B-like isoform X2 [Varroa destructor]
MITIITVQPVTPAMIMKLRMRTTAQRGSRDEATNDTASCSRTRSSWPTQAFWLVAALWAVLLVGDAGGIDLPGRGGRKGGIQIGQFNKNNQNLLTDMHRANTVDGAGGNGELNPNRPNVTYVMIVPSTRFESVRRKYRSTINEALNQIKNGKVPGNHLNKHYSLQFQLVYLSLAPTPREILDTLCTEILNASVLSVGYFTNSETFGSNAASVEYVHQLLGYLGIPVISWNPDNIALDERVTDAHILGLSPSVDHQVNSIFDFLDRYQWTQFAIITTQLAGHENFIRAIREKVFHKQHKYSLIAAHTLPRGGDADKYFNLLQELADGEVRVIVLFCGTEDAREIFLASSRHGITGKNYAWIVTQAVIGSAERSPAEFPTGLIGMYYNFTLPVLLDEMEKSMYIFASALERLVNHTTEENRNQLSTGLTCNASEYSYWRKGEEFYKYLKETEWTSKKFNSVAFNFDGTRKRVDLDILNLDARNVWEKIGDWGESGVDIKDIIWPGEERKPPKGVPEKFNLKVTFMEERPFVIVGLPDPETGECESSRAVKCRIAPESALIGLNDTMARRHPNYYRCCMGFCIDLLEKFAQDLGFTYDLSKVEDGMWGVKDKNGKWNGLIAALLNRHTDIVVTSIKINSDRQEAVDFTVPFLETGIAIVVAKRTGIISPKAFLEPFDTVSWLLILLVGIQVAAFSIFIFEFLSPDGYDMKIAPPRNYKFSLFRTYWLVWAVLFGAAVNVDCPRGYTARFMSNVWAMFAVVFLAIYTANLAAFMITREEYYDLSGIEDSRLRYPHLMEPPFRFGTIPYGNTEQVLQRNKPTMYEYMRPYNRSNVNEGIKAVKKGTLDAFIYDATVLDYFVGQDDECRLLTVGSWYAMTGYGFALPKKSKYLQMFNRQMIEYREHGDLERLQRFWLQGACKPDKRKRNAGNPLDINQFMSAFLLLGCGVLLTVVLLILEHVYFRYCRKQLAKANFGSCFSLISLLSFVRDLIIMSRVWRTGCNVFTRFSKTSKKKNP